MLSADPNPINQRPPPPPPSGRHRAEQTSGAIHSTVPRAARTVLVRMAETELPKSVSLTTPLSDRRMLAPLMSRWMIPLPWRYCSPCSTWYRYMRSRSSSRAPKRSRMHAMEPPGRYSRMMQNPSLRSVPKYLTTLGWSNERRVSTSAYRRTGEVASGGDRSVRSTEVAQWGCVGGDVSPDRGPVTQKIPPCE